MARGIVLAGLAGLAGFATLLASAPLAGSKLPDTTSPGFDERWEDRAAPQRPRGCIERYPSPGIRGESLDCVPFGAETESLRRDGDWTLIRLLNGTVGWVKRPSQPTASPAAKPTQETYPTARVRVASCLKRRSSPKADAFALDCLPYDDEVSILREQEAWSLARSQDGTVGWVASLYLAKAVGIGATSPVVALRATPPPLSSLPSLPESLLRGVPVERSAQTRPARSTDVREPRGDANATDRAGRGRAPRIYPAVEVKAHPCLSLRAAAEDGSGVLDCLPYGTVVETLGKLDEWTQVRTADGQRGWVVGDYLAAAYGAVLLLTDADVDHVDPTELVDPSEPMPDPEPEDRGLEVDKWATSDEPADGLMIVGMLRNMGTRVTTAVDLTVQVFDYEQNVVLEQGATVDTTILMPGQGTRFQVSLPGVFAFRAVKFKPSSVDFEVVDTEWASTL